MEKKGGRRFEIKKGFDPGMVTHSFGFSNGISFSLPSFAFIRLYEEGALPMTCGSITMFSKDLGLAAKLIFYDAFDRSICSLLRAKNEEIIDLFNRVYIATLPPN